MFAIGMAGGAGGGGPVDLGARKGTLCRAPHACCSKLLEDSVYVTQIADAVASVLEQTLCSRL